jgi:hypothetical protein
MATSTSSIVTNGYELNASDISYGKPSNSAGGGKNVAINHKSHGSRLHLATPLMLTWGVNRNDYKDAGVNINYSMGLQFPRPGDALLTEHTEQFLNRIKELESKIKADAIENSMLWFNKSKEEFIPQVVDMLWVPLLKYPNKPGASPDSTVPDYSRPPTLQVKLPWWSKSKTDSTKVFNCKVFDENGERLFPNTDPSVTPVTLLTKYSTVAVVMECGGIWFTGGKFGITWRMTQCIVQPKADLNDTCCIALPNSVKTNTVVDLNAVTEEEESQTVGVEVADSDDEIEVEDDEVVKEEVVEEVNVPPPVPVVKKVVKRNSKKS